MEPAVTADGPPRGQLAAHVLRRLADLPVAIRERPLERGLDIGAVEWRQRQHRPAPDRRAPEEVAPGTTSNRLLPMELIA